MTLDTGKYNQDEAKYRELVKAIYDKYPAGVTLPPEYADFVDNNLLRFYIRLARYKFIARILRKTDRVMEVGSGSGLGSIFISQHCKEVVGLDVKTTEVEEARALNHRSNVSFQVADLFSLPPTKSFDAVIALDVIEHMDVPMGLKLIDGMKAQLKDTGLLVIGTPSIHSYPYQSPLSQASHVKCYDLPELLQSIDTHFERVIPFSMNDELVHTGHPKMAWYYFVIATHPK